MKKKLAFIAIGGNSLVKSKFLQSIEDQDKGIQETAIHIVDLIEQGYQVMISHGNGPQVGFIMRRSEVTRKATGLHPVPLVIVVADTQGSIGFQIQIAMHNELRSRGMDGLFTTIVTQVLVDKNDPAFSSPSKPVGEFYQEDEIAKIREENPDWTLIEDSGRGYRRVVASPKPIEVVERPVIESMLASGFNVIAAGGGGIPVVHKDSGLEGVNAVIDKDLASSLLAAQLKADLLIISTAIKQVALNFGKPDEKLIGTMTVSEAETYIKEGHFAPGSMLPKIEAAVEFIKNGGKEVIITAPENIKEAVLNNGGTHIVA